MTLSARERSGLTKRGCLREPLLDKMLEASAERMNLTRIGLGQRASALNFPRRKQSLIDCP